MMIKSYIANKRIVSIATLIAVLCASIGCVRREELMPLTKEGLKGSGTLYFVPLGDFPANKVNDLASYYRNKYGIQIETRPGVPLSPTAINTERDQLIAEKAVEIMKQANPELTNDPQAIMIGISNRDMYIDKFSWQFSYGFRTQGKYAVVSSGRMDESNGGQEVTEELISKRLRKMVTKYIGILYFRLPQSDDPRSVLYREIGGISELDYMGEEF